MATHDYIISNGTGTVIRADINNALSAIVTNNSSSSEPATKYAYMWWADTSAGLLKIRNSANDAWITLFQLDGTLTLEDGSSSAPALSFRDDTNTGIFSSAADNLDITTGGTTRVNVSSTGINVTGTVTDDGATHDGDVTFTGASANIVFDKSDNALEFADNAKAVFGSDSDLQILHNGSDSFVRDLGTGGLYLTGSVVGIKNSGANENGLLFTEDGSIDLFHNNVKVFETTSTGVSVTGGLTTTGTVSFNSTSDNVNFIGANYNALWNPASNFFRFNDNAKAIFGTGNDLEIYHDGSNSYIQDAGTGVLRLSSNQVQVTNAAASEVLANFIEDGAVELFHNNVKVFETTATGVAVTGGLTATSHITLPDDVRLKVGTGEDLHIYHNGSNSVIREEGTGNLNIQTTGGNVEVLTNTTETSAKFISNGAVELYYDNNKKLETLSNGAKITGTFVPDGDGNRDLGSTSLQWQNVYIDNDLFIGDNGKAIFGDGSDLQIYHDGTDSYIQNETNDLFIDNNGDDIVIRTVDTIFFQVNNTENTITAKANGAVELYYDNVKKLETTSTGIKVIQDVVMDVAGDTAIRWANNGTNKWSIFNNSSASDALTIFDNNGSGTAAKFSTNGAVELYHDNSKKLETTSFGATVQGGITFGSDTAAANQLHDYEEGTWTPILTFGGLTTGITYSSMRGGSYVKIGRQVTVNFGFTLTSKGSTTGDAHISGLPFAVEDLLSSTSVEASGVSAFWNDVATDSANIVFSAVGGQSQLNIRHTVGAEDDTDDMTDGDFQNDTAIRGSITYFTAT